MTASMLCRMGNLTLEITAGGFNNSTFLTLSGQVLLGWLKLDCENKNKHVSVTLRIIFQENLPRFLERKKNGQPRGKDGKRTSRLLFSASGNLCCVFSRHVGGGCKKTCSVPTLSSGKYICRKKSFWTPQTFFLCTAMRKDAVLKYSIGTVIHIYPNSAGALLCPP